MVFIWESQESTGNTALLQDIEERQTFSDGKTVVLLAVDDQLRRIKLQDVLWGRWIPATVVLTVRPECAIELEWKSVLKEGQHITMTHIMLNEPKLLGRDLCIGNKGSIMANQCLELTTQWVSLDPVDHETTIAGACSHTTVGIDKVEVIADVLPALN